MSKAGAEVRPSRTVRHKKGVAAPVKTKLPYTAIAGAGFVTSFMTQAGLVDVDRVADAFSMSKGQLAVTAGLALASVTKADRRTAPKAQTRVTEVLEIISLVRDWAGGEAQAMAWYRSQPIPALDGRTAEALVKAGRAHAVREYLDHLALGGFA